MQDIFSTTVLQGVSLLRRVVGQTPPGEGITGLQPSPPPVAETAVTSGATTTDTVSGGITPITGGSSRPFFDFGSFLSDALLLFFWSLIGAVAFALVAALAMRIFNLLTPGIDEMAELRRGNIAVGIVLMGFLLTIAAVVIAVVIK